MKPTREDSNLQTPGSKPGASPFGFGLVGSDPGRIRTDDLCRDRAVLCSLSYEIGLCQSLRIRSPPPFRRSVAELPRPVAGRFFKIRPDGVEPSSLRYQRSALAAELRS